MTERAWRWLLLALTIGVLAAVLDAQPRTVTLGIGRFGATDQELQECWFSVGRNAMLALDPKGEPCIVARELIGRTGMLVFVPD